MTDASLHHLSHVVPFRLAEAKGLAALASGRRRFRRHQIIRAQGDPVAEVYLLIEGWVAASVDSVTGNRQIVKVHLPGDMLGAPSLSVSTAAETLCALNRVTIDVIPSECLGDLFLSSPKLAAALFLSAQQERIWLMDRLMSIGRTNAAQRLAAFLLSLFDRLRLIEGVTADGFDLPLSQGEVANVIGITPVHVNRTFSALQQRDLIERRGRSVRLMNIEGLRDLASVPAREFQHLPGWLKGSRDKPRATPERAGSTERKRPKKAG